MSETSAYPVVVVIGVAVITGEVEVEVGLAEVRDQRTVVRVVEVRVGVVVRVAGVALPVRSRINLRQVCGQGAVVVELRAPCRCRQSESQTSARR